ncbi:MAG: sigma-70 family RNA polymerase sigma factor [Anaerolineae bacterium]|nr:sigma-70 family RNA polymerase sigma factor [Phycisphaerae bacterium]
MSEESGSCITYRTGQALLEEFEQTGAENAFEEIVRLYAGMVYSVCHQVTKNGHDAEDSAQATFLALATQVKTGKQVKYLGPWLRQVAKRTALDLRKSRKRREKREENHSRDFGKDRFDGNAGEAKVESDDYKTVLHDEINRLPARYRLPLVMHYFGGLPPEQTALELNCKPKTLAVRLHRGRKMLQQSLTRRGIFVGGEMLGIASPLFMYHMMGGHLAHSTAHAAAGITAGFDITAIVSTRVMSLLKSSAKVALFAKIKFLSVILVMLTTMFAGSVKAVQTISAHNLALPRMNFDITQWLKPMLRSLLSDREVIAQAAPAPAATSADRPTFAPANHSGGIALTSSSSSRFVSDISLSTMRAAHRASNVMLTSYEPLASSAPRIDPMSMPARLVEPVDFAASDLTDMNDGTVQLRYATAPTTGPSTNGLGSIAMDNVEQANESVWVIGSDGAATLVRRANVGVTPTPEPMSIATLLIAGGFLLRRKPANRN